MMNSASSGSPQSDILSPKHSVVLQEEEKKNHGCQIFVKCLIKFVISSAFVVWVIYAIIALVNDNYEDIKDVCKQSHLWPCLCTMAGISVFHLLHEGIPKNSQDEYPNLSKTSLALCFTIAAYIWMAIELFNRCAIDNLTHYKIYQMLEILFWLYSSCLVLIMIIICGICISCVGEFNKKYDNTSSPSESILNV